MPVEATKHTQGPWNVSAQDNDRRFICTLSECLAEVFGSEPNAHLIAAAPEMFAALEELYPHCHDAAMEGETDFERAWLKAEAAIKKARGAR